MSSTKAISLHRCRFAEYVPSAIIATAFSADGSRLAVARMDGNIELWRTRAPGPVKHEWFADLVLVNKQTVRSLAWTSTDGQERLFSAGLSGNILEWDLSTGSVKHTTDSYAGPVWSIATDPAGRYLAAACEDGLRLFGIADGTLQFAKAYSKAGKQRYLSVAWNKEGSLLYTGGADGFLRQWNVSSTSSTLVIKHAKIKGSFLWALTVLPDGTVVVGDSHGEVTLWDPNTATQIYSLKTHKADVLTLAYTTASNDPSQIFIVASGPDSFLTCLRRISAAGPGGYQWTLGGKYRHHKRDVFALAISPTTQEIASGGVEGSLHATELAVLLRDSNRSISTYPPLSPSSLVSYSASSRCFLYRSSHSEMEVWRAGREVPGALAEEAALYPGELGRPLPISEMPALLAKLQIKSGEKIISSALSPSGNTIACADTSGLKLFRLTRESPEDPLRVQKQEVQGLPDGERMAWVAWMGDDFVVAGSFKGGVHVIDVLPSPKSIAFCAGDWTRASQPWQGAAAVSTHGKWIAASRYGGAIDLFQFDKSGEQPELSFRGSIPSATEHCAALALAFVPNTDVLFATRMGADKKSFSGADFLFFDVERMAHATSYGKYKVNMAPAAYRAIEFDPSSPGRVMLVSPSLLWFGRLDTETVSHTKTGSYEWVLHAAFGDDGESLFVVERPQEFIDEKLPAPTKGHKYGVA